MPGMYASWHHKCWQLSAYSDICRFIKSPHMHLLQHRQLLASPSLDSAVMTLPIRMLFPQVKALLHAADISNHIRPFPIALGHAERVQQEFRRQVAREHALGLPISPHMDAPEQTWYKMEVQFIDYVAGPLWERLGQVGGNGTTQHRCDTGSMAWPLAVVWTVSDCICSPNPTLSISNLLWIVGLPSECSQMQTQMQNCASALQVACGCKS